MLWPLDSSDLLTMVNQQVDGARRALFTDIDDTLIDRARRSRVIAAAWELREWADTHNCPVVLVSGVHFAGILSRLKLGEIPPAEAIIGAVGTELWLRQPDGSWLHDNHYDKLVRASGFQQQDVAQAAAFLAEELNSHYPELRLQLETLPQHLRKVSLHFFAEDNEVELVAKEFRREFPEYHVVTCQEIHYNSALPPGSTVFKHCLDIVPATKQTAISYLIDRLGLTHGYKAGDSGNDVDMLLNPDPLLPILVGGYKPEALAAIGNDLLVRRPGLIQYLKDGRSIYIENGERVGAQSILHATRMVRAAGKREDRRSSLPAADQPIAAQ